MPAGLKQSSSLITIGFSVTESGANTFTQGNVDLQLNPLTMKYSLCKRLTWTHSLQTLTLVRIRQLLRLLRRRPRLEWQTLATLIAWLPHVTTSELKQVWLL